MHSSFLGICGTQEFSNPLAWLSRIKLAEYSVDGDGHVVRRDLSSVVLDHHGGYTSDGVMQGGSFSTVMPGEYDQHDGLILDPQNSGIIGDERLPVSRLVGNPHIVQISREAVVDLLHLHGVQQSLAGILRD